MHYVLDPSVVMKWYVPETLTSAAVYLRDQVEEKSQLIAVPQLFFVEAANVIWKKSVLKKEFSWQEAERIYTSIMKLPFHVIEDREVLSKAMDLASVYSVSVYDAVYLACAIHLKAVFVTADMKFAGRFMNTNLKRYVLALADIA